MTGHITFIYTDEKGMECFVLNFNTKKWKALKKHYGIQVKTI